MINFYKQDGIGKIAFNDGNIYVPQGNVTLLLDTTTEKIIVAEDERLIYWISLSQPLKVNGTQISGTDAEKLAFIAPVFQNEGGGGGTGGASARFGYPGEDNISTVDRTVDMGGKGLLIDNSSGLQVNGFDGYNGFGVFSGDENTRGTYIYSQSPDGLHPSVQVLIKDGTLSYQTFNDGGNLRSYSLPQLSDLPSPPNSRWFMPLSVNSQIADASGDIPLVPTQSFDSNSEAVAALGVGKLYKSTTLINGSPIILITV